MNSSTKIVVIPMKRLIICGIAALAVIILIIVKVFSVLYSGLYLYFSLTSHYNRKKREAKQIS